MDTTGYTEINRGEWGKQWRRDFANGYGVSVIQGPHTYGGSAGLYELAVMKDGELTYDTPITNDVEGHLTWGEVEAIAARVKALGPEVVQSSADTDPLD